MKPSQKQDAQYAERLYHAWVYKAAGIPVYRAYRRYDAARKRFLARYSVDYADYLHSR